MIPKINTRDEVCRGCNPSASIHGKMSLEPSSVFVHPKFSMAWCGYSYHLHFISDDHTQVGMSWILSSQKGLLRWGPLISWINVSQLEPSVPLCQFNVDEVKEDINKKQNKGVERRSTFLFWYQSVNFMALTFSSSGVTRRVFWPVGDKAGLSTSWFIEFLGFDHLLGPGLKTGLGMGRQLLQRRSSLHPMDRDFL